jgi:hypothetical protein
MCGLWEMGVDTWLMNQKCTVRAMLKLKYPGFITLKKKH